MEYVLKIEVREYFALLWKEIYEVEWDMIGQGKNEEKLLEKDINVAYSAWYVEENRPWYFSCPDVRESLI